MIISNQSHFSDLGQIAEINTGKLDSNAAKDDGEYPFFTCAPETLAIDEYAFDTEAVLLAGNNASGKFNVKYYNGKFNAYQRTYVIEPKERDKLDCKYLMYVLAMRLAEMERLSIGSTTRFLTRKILDKFEIPLLSISIQKRIASTLSAVDKAIEQAGIAIEESERMKRGLMNKLLDDISSSCGICSTPKTKLGEVVSLRKDQVSPHECLGMKFVGLEHLIPGQQEVYNYGIIDDQRSLKSRFFEGDVLYGKLRPYLDKGGIVSFDGCCSTDILVLIADKNKTIPEFISKIIHKTDFIAYAMAHKNGTNHPRTSWKALANYEFNLPSIENQKRIVNVLKNTESLTILFNRRKSLLETLKRGMMQQLLSGVNQS